VPQSWYIRSKWNLRNNIFMKEYFLKRNNKFLKDEFHKYIIYIRFIPLEPFFSTVGISFCCALFGHINHAMPLFTLLSSGKLVTYATICGIYKCTSPRADAPTLGIRYSGGYGYGHSIRNGA